MKINGGFRPFGNDLLKPDTASHPPLQGKTFSDLMGQQEREHSDERLRKTLQQIELQGERLIKSMTVRELHAYKVMIRKFLEDTVRRGVGIRETRGWDRRGRGKKYKLLDEIDMHLIEMGEEMLTNEQGRIDILDRIGEIKGLLVNLLS